MVTGSIAIGIAFWVFVMVATVSGLIYDYRKRKLEFEPIKAAIERGQTIDPAIVQQLMMREPPSKEINPLHLRIGGYITAATGVGFALLGQLLGKVVPLALYPVVGFGALVLCVGLGLIMAARAVERDQRRRLSLHHGPAA